ncbi:MAG: folylpolyglutamate synthase/dihydrofolate synthase family protein [Verrucomicrobiota bacterium]
MTYEESIAWLYSTQTFGIKLGLENPSRLLREYLAFPAHTQKVIQVAGTNGKGSTCAFLDSLARATGLRTGLFTSPHLVSFRERIRVSTEMISEEAVAQGLTELRDLVADWEHHPTFFELTLALAMRWFRNRQCDLIILEVGMGGRFDATTAVPADATVITPIDLDHQKWLGGTIEEIAFEKASVAREGKPCLSSTQKPEAEKIIRQTANQTRAPLTFVTQPARGYPIGIPGTHQAENAALALEALHAINIHLSYDAVHHGLSSTRHPGRFEVTLYNDSPLILDIAHNPHATKSLVATLKSYARDKTPALIFGAAESKDIRQMLNLLEPHVSNIHLVPINSPRSVPPAELATLTNQPSTQHPDLTSALDATKDAALTLITGSAFLVGEMKALLENETQLPSSQ